MSVADATLLVKTNNDFPAPRRAQVLSSLRQLPNWANAVHASVMPCRPETMPFTKVSVEALFDKLVPAIAGVSRKRLQNARADCRFVMQRYGLARERLRVKLTPAIQVLDQALSKFERIPIQKLLIFLSIHNIDPAGMSDAIADQFRVWVHCYGFKNPDTIADRAISAWNEAVRHPQWPKITLAIPNKRIIWGSRFTAFPASYEAAVDAFFARGASTKGSLFAEDSEVPSLRQDTITGQKECMRLAASALVRSGLKHQQVSSLRDVCRPARYKRALDDLALHWGPNRSVGLVAAVLAKVAKYSGVLSSAEFKEVQKAHAKVRVQVRRYLKENKAADRGQELLNHLDNAAVLDALLRLPRRTVCAVLASGRKTRREAVLVVKALALEIWLCTSLRLKNMRHLRLDQHFFRITLDGADHVVIRIPAAEVKNGKSLEHFLNADTVNLLQLYLDEFLPILTKTNPSVYLFPGRAGRPKAPQVFRSQMNKFVRDGTGLDFHPHAIRKITTKIYLDQDPAGIEVARRNLGDTEETTRDVYTQHVQRASQRKFVEALESRRLAAFSPLHPMKRQRR